MNRTMAKKVMPFETAMTRLEEILHTLEDGGESLDASLKLYEEGIELIRACTLRLEQAEQKVKVLQIQADGQAVLSDFDKGEKPE